MTTILRIVLLLGGIFYGVMGARFLFDPAGAAEGFALSATGPHGWATIRGDMAAFFLVGALGLIWGAARRASTPLVFTAALFGIALTGRAINLAQAGSYEGWWTPMVVETATMVIALIAASVLSRTARH
ncbi:hypothetical protein AAG596_14915 [Citromicrobium bathyomarinum]|uniref:hypothetical protein n=1 Tax=Citromicrobium bathyomarinum TaxID=72174 RepID=UPI00315A2541